MIGIVQLCNTTKNSECPLCAGKMTEVPQYKGTSVECKSGCFSYLHTGFETDLIFINDYTIYLDCYKPEVVAGNEETQIDVSRFSLESLKELTQERINNIAVFG